MTIKLFNTLKKKKEEFLSLEQGKVKMYSCGPTVYHYAHIGNLRAYLTADILKRMFIFNNYKIKHVMNITDVGHLTSDADVGEDKMVIGAKREGKTVWEIAEYYTEEFKKDMNEMNIIFPTFTKATEHVEDMIKFINKIEKQGFTYIQEGNVYFDTSKIKDYQKLIGGRLKDESKKARVNEDTHKKNQTDFVLWFTRHKHGNHAMIWQSPWGEGFPGWHIECSAMSCKYLGEKFDIHTGAVDLMPIHHSNEIAQSQGAHNQDPVNYWVHNEFLVMSEGKMSKSTGEFVRLNDLIKKGYTTEDYRYLLLGTHYRKKMLFSYEVLDFARTTMNKLRNKVLELQKIKKVNEKELQQKEYNRYLEQFRSEINDDLNTPKCLATTWSVLNNKNLTAKTKLDLILKFDEVLGLRLNEIKIEEIPKKILEIKKQRDQARKNKNWSKSDELKNLLKEKGYKVQDLKEGSEVIKE